MKETARKQNMSLLSSTPGFLTTLSCENKRNWENWGFENNTNAEPKYYLFRLHFSSLFYPLI
jgi:hypothetical protein